MGWLEMTSERVAAKALMWLMVTLCAIPFLIAIAPIIPLLILAAPFLIYFWIKVEKAAVVLDNPSATSQQKWEASRDVLVLASAGAGLAAGVDGLVDGADALFDGLDGAEASVSADPGLAPEVNGQWAPIDDTYGEASLADGDPRSWHRVDGYSKADGTYVKSHWKSKAG